MTRRTVTSARVEEFRSKRGGRVSVGVIRRLVRDRGPPGAEAEVAGSADRSRLLTYQAAVPKLHSHNTSNSREVFALIMQIADLGSTTTYLQHRAISVTPVKRRPFDC